MSAQSELTFDGVPASEPDRPQWTEASVKGTVSSVVFASEDGAYAVIRLEDAQHRESVLVGALAAVGEGQDIAAWGQWERHKEYGRQFRVKRFEALLPTTEEGVRRYLASGIIPGIGPKLADRIVDRFGVETLNILDHYSARLLEIPGFGKGRLKQIKDAWRSQSERREIYIFLQGLGLSAAYCDRVYRKYAANAVELVRENPYRLAREVKGIGFRMADTIARHLNIAPDNPFRLGAGASYVLSTMAERQGHTYVPRDVLLVEAARLLEVEEDVAATGLQRAVEDGTAVIDSAAKEPLVYPTDLYRAECDVAEIIVGMTAGSGLPTLPPQALARSRNWTMLNEAQQAAVLNVFQHQISIITGGPGVGKTTVTREIVTIARDLNWNVALAAPTGRAAKRLSESSQSQAQTIHRLLKWEPELSGFAHNGDNPLKHQLVILDEVSMLDIHLAASLFRALSAETRVVLVGDRDQLPSVGPGTFLRDLIESKCVLSTHLHEVYRQAGGSQIIVSAHQVNAGQLPKTETPQPSGELSDFYWIEQEDQEKLVDVVCRMAAERIPKRFNFSPHTDIQILSPMNRGICGADNLNTCMQAALNPPRTEGWSPEITYGDVVYRAGDRIMQISNNYDYQVFNGDLGRMLQIDTKQKNFTVRYESNTVTYGFDEVDQIRLAYAITIHKSQGSEFPVVIVPVLNQHYVMLQRNLIYTAMTRAARLLIMIGSTKALSIAVHNVNQAPRYSQLAERLQM